MMLRLQRRLHFIIFICVKIHCPGRTKPSMGNVSWSSALGDDDDDDAIALLRVPKMHNILTSLAFKSV